MGSHRTELNWCPNILNFEREAYRALTYMYVFCVTVSTDDAVHDALSLRSWRCVVIGYKLDANTRLADSSPCLNRVFLIAPQTSTPRTKATQRQCNFWRKLWICWSTMCGRWTTDQRRFWTFIILTSSRKLWAIASKFRRPREIWSRFWATAKRPWNTAWRRVRSSVTN